MSEKYQWIIFLIFQYFCFGEAIIQCYKCENCQFPEIGQLVDCPTNECYSYIADGKFTRGCSDYPDSCDVLPDEANCKNCVTSGCNGILKGIQCNSCDNCEIDDLGTLETCDERVNECFVHVEDPIKKTYSRGCSPHDNYCNDFVYGDQCISCKAEKCNDITKVIECYSCDVCQINDLGSVTADIRTKECYIDVVNPLGNYVSRGSSNSSGYCTGSRQDECWTCSKDRCNSLISKCLTCVDERPNGKCTDIQEYSEKYCFPGNECYFTTYGVNRFYKSMRGCGSPLTCLDKDWLSLGVDVKSHGGESICETCTGVQCNNRQSNGSHAYTSGYFNIFLTVLYFIYIYL